MKQYLVIHHSLTRDGQTVSWDTIRSYHTRVKGWAECGYQFGVELIGNHHEMLVGRPLLDRAAAATQKNMNRLGVHVCFVGNYDVAPPPPSMLEFAFPHLASICDALNIPIDREHVIGHREVAPYKSCPGTQFDLDAFVERLRGE
jgi:hypothetical protein